MLPKPKLLQIAEEICLQRPAADHSLEQFLMESESMVEQVYCLMDFEFDTSVVFIGDDDHLSLLLAEALGCAIDVYDIDQRIVDSINRLASQRDVRVRAYRYDVMDPFPRPGQYRRFYINPPYSSKTRGLGAKVWIRRALEAVSGDGTGILVYPGFESQQSLTWIVENVHAIQAYLTDAGCFVYRIDVDKHRYRDTNDPYLLSTNYHIKRAFQTEAPEVRVANSESLYR